IELTPPGTGSNQLMALFMRMPVPGRTMRAPNSDNNVCVSVTTLPLRSTIAMCVVDVGAPRSPASPMRSKRSFQPARRARVAREGLRIGRPFGLHASLLVVLEGNPQRRTAIELRQHMNRPLAIGECQRFDLARPNGRQIRNAQIAPHRRNVLRNRAR